MHGTDAAGTAAQYAELLNLIMQAKAAAGAAAAAAGITHSNLQVEEITASLAAAPLSNSPMLKTTSAKSLQIALGQTPFAAGESASINLFRNGVSILTAPIVLSAATPAGSVVNAFSDIDAPGLPAGSELTASILYTPGGTPNHPNFLLSLGSS